jgi:hypothetical protein
MATPFLSSLFFHSSVVLAKPAHKDIKMLSANFSMYPVLAGIIGFYVVYYIVRSFTVAAARRKFIKENHCQPAPQYPSGDPILNLSMHLQNVKLFKTRQFLPEVRKRFQKYGNTYGLNVMGMRGRLHPLRSSTLADTTQPLRLWNQRTSKPC